MNLPSVSISLFHNTFQINRSIYYVVYCIHFFPLNLTLLRFIHDTDFIKYFPSEPHSLKTETVLEVPASKVPPNMPSLTSRVRAKMFGELFDRKNWSVPTSCLAHVRPWVPLLAHQDGLRELETLPLIDNYREKSWKAEEPGSGWAPHWVKAVSHGTVANCQWTKERGTQVNKPPSRWDVASKCKESALKSALSNSANKMVEPGALCTLQQGWTDNSLHRTEPSRVRRLWSCEVKKPF